MPRSNSVCKQFVSGRYIDHADDPELETTIGPRGNCNVNLALGEKVSRKTVVSMLYYTVKIYQLHIFYLVKCEHCAS